MAATAPHMNDVRDKSGWWGAISQCGGRVRKGVHWSWRDEHPTASLFWMFLSRLAENIGT